MLIMMMMMKCNLNVIPYLRLHAHTEKHIRHWPSQEHAQSEDISARNAMVPQKL